MKSELKMLSKVRRKVLIMFIDDLDELECVDLNFRQFFC